MKKLFLDKPVIRLLLIVLLGLLCYSNTFHVPFLYDDAIFITNNPLVKDFGYFIDQSKSETLNLPIDVRRYIKTRHVGYLSLWANYRLGGLKVEGYHVANLALHVINALLVYLVVLLTFRTPALGGSPIRERSGLIALFAGLLFVAHPIQTEAVTYILQRLVILAAMFYLLSMVLYIGSRLSEGRASKYMLYALSLIAAVLGMKTKENTFLLPVTIALYEILFFRGGFKKKAVCLLPLLLTMLIIPLSYMGMNVDYGGLGNALDTVTRLEPGSRLDYLFTQFRVVVSYLGLLLVPVGQNVDHDPSTYHSFFEPPVFLSFLLLLGIFCLGILLYYRSRITDHALRVAAFGIFWFFLALSVESSVMPIGEMMVEYRVYLPSAGFFTAIMVLLFAFCEYLKARWPIADKAVVSLLFLVVFVLGGTAYTRNTVWQNEVSLWEDSVRKSPRKARPHNNVGSAYYSNSLTDKAIEHYRIAIELKPDYALAHNNLGVAYMSRGLTEKAIKHYLAALDNNPSDAQAHNNLGIAYKTKGLIDKAIEQYFIALKLKPDNVKTYNNLGNAYKLKGLIDKAIEQYLVALELDPEYTDAHYNLGNTYLSISLVDKAIQHYLTALRLDPAYNDAHFRLAVAYGKKGLMGKSIEHFHAVLTLTPENAEAHYNLGVAYDFKGMIDKAIKHYQSATMLKPDYAKAHFGLGELYIKKGLIDRARIEIETALKLSPDHKEAEQLLEDVKMALKPKEK